MDRAVRDRLGKGIVDKAVLVDEREPGEPRARDRHLEMVPAPRSVLDGQLGRLGKGAAEELLQAGAHRTNPTAASVELVSNLVLDRPLFVRLFVSAAFVVAGLAFTLPFMAIYSDRRAGEGTGVELALGEPAYSGAYVHEAYEGQVEGPLRDARLPALVALVAAVLVWLPWRLGPAAGTTAGLVALLGLAGLFQATTTLFGLAATDRRYGFWLAGIALAVATTWSTAVAVKTRWWLRPPAPDPARRDFFAPRET